MFWTLLNTTEIPMKYKSTLAPKKDRPSERSSIWKHNTSICEALVFTAIKC